MVRRVRLALLALACMGVIVVACGALGGCSARYVLRSAWYQAEMLYCRRPVEEVRRSGRLSAREQAALDVIEEAKQFGIRIGLKPTRNYDSVAVGWNRTLWNVSACEPLAFEARTWWFPVVGRVPYLGFFREEDARRQARKLEVEGLDVHVRTTAAYSTLGWFRDPILPAMLRWNELDLAETVLHELVHATLWIPGNVAFNESLADFVGGVAAFRFVAERHGQDSEAYRRRGREAEDEEDWRRLLHGLFQDLDAVYGNEGLSAAEKLSRKTELFGTLPARVDAAGFHDVERFRRSARPADWNNARLIQFRTYNASREWFQAVLDRNDGDLPRFLREIQDVARRGKDPFRALERAVPPQPPAP